MIAQGRLAAEGDFRAIRDLMDDRPHRLRIATDAAGRFAAGLLEAGVASGVRVTSPESLEVETTDVHGFRQAVAVIAPTRPRARRGRAPRRRPRQRLPLPGGPMIATSTGHPAHAGQEGPPGGAHPARRGRHRHRPGRRAGGPPRSRPAATNMINAFGLSLYAPLRGDAGVRVGVARRSGRGRHPRLPLAAAGRPLADRGRHLPGHPHRSPCPSYWCRSACRPRCRAPATASSAAPSCRPRWR